MKVELSLVEGFERLYDSYVNDPQKLRLLEIEGIAPRSLDVGNASNEFFNNKLS